MFMWFVSFIYSVKNFLCSSYISKISSITLFSAKQILSLKNYQFKKFYLTSFLCQCLRLGWCFCFLPTQSGSSFPRNFRIEDFARFPSAQIKILLINKNQINVNQIIIYRNVYHVISLPLFF